MVTKSDIETVFLVIKLWPMFNILYLINFGQNFYILVASSANYRKIVQTKLKLKRATRNDSVAVSRVPVRATDYVDFRTDVTELCTNISPSDIYFFPELRDCKCETDEEVVGVVEEFLGLQEKAWSSEGLTMLEKRWTKCTELNGDYVEK
ncbi:uncharacterized protein LOC121373164 [Gigantopelta aegis]|uniref:uncharacterized protein LOC121373164 n=1 Tax=Gigantopelta aegis TaxID=1735272 RepID=UPI001B88C64B|nr:uncharacterized protein LOC121373164 [Gigantopelta aegis]